MDLLDLYNKEKEDTFSIGIITPYTGQVALLKALFINKSYDLDFQERVKIGTVHTFQGSECDIHESCIVWSIDCRWLGHNKETVERRSGQLLYRYGWCVSYSERVKHFPFIGIAFLDALKLYMVCDFGNHNNIWLSFP